MRTLAPFLVMALLCAAKVRPRDGRFRVSAPRKAGQRAGYRNADWKKLRRLLVSEGVTESEKRKWTVEFLVAYWRSPGVEPEMAKLLALHVPPCKMREALRALARGGKPTGSAGSEGLPGFGETAGAVQAPRQPEPPGPLEALLIAKAREYDARRAAIQQKQLALLQGTSQDPTADAALVRRQLSEVLGPLQNEVCKLSDQYADKFGPLALKGLWAREKLSEPLDVLRCP